MAISKRIPGWGQIAPVYAVIVLILYSWTILSFLWLVPGWLYYLKAGEIVTVFTYASATNLVESLAVLCVCLLPRILLPGEWFRDTFVARGSALAMSGLGYLMYVAFQYRNKSGYPEFALSLWSLALGAVIILLVVYAAGRFDHVRRGIEGLADRATIFLYVSVPVSVISLAVVAVRAVR